MRCKSTIVLLSVSMLLAGCDKAPLPFLGNWTGAFQVDKNSSDMPTDRLAMRGYLQLYRTGSKFILEFSNPAQTIDVTGTWKILNPTRISLHTDHIKIEQAALDKLGAIGTPILSSDAIYEAYTPDLIFDLSKDKSKLSGLLMKIGPLLGRHVLSKTSMGAPH